MRDGGAPARPGSSSSNEQILQSPRGESNSHAPPQGTTISKSRVYQFRHSAQVFVKRPDRTDAARAGVEPASPG